MNFEACEEMEEYRSILDKRNIKWIDKSDEWMCRTHFHMENGDLVSVINGVGSYGGAMPRFDIMYPTHNAGLLELMNNRINGGEPVGNLTATEVIKLINKAYDNILE